MNSVNFDDLPRETCMGGGRILYKWGGFWYNSIHLEGTIKAQNCFEARDDDIFLTSSIKTGTTWLKALIPCIMAPNARVVSRKGEISSDGKLIQPLVGCNDDDYLDPLTLNHPNVLIPSLELQIYSQDSAYDVSSMSSPRLFRTHIPYSGLPESIKNSECKIVYITRNPKDTCVSWWHFANSIRGSEQRSLCALPIAQTFYEFSNGFHPFGPFHDHVLEYWNESLKRPGKILFMRYEEMKRDPNGQVKKLALFLGRPFESEEEVEKVVWRCSIDRLKNLEVNKAGRDPWIGIPKSAYFRNGVVGDWKSSLTPEMIKVLDETTHSKLKGSGLDLST